MTQSFTNNFHINVKIIWVIYIMMNNNIKFCREELEMTQKELGNVFGVSFKTVAGWEK